MGRAADAAFDSRKRAAIDLMRRHERVLRRTARRYSICSDDAEDALQRALEILLMKAPTSDQRELIRWMQTVTKHEALAVRRNRERHLATPAPPASGEESDWVQLIPSDKDGPADAAERRERVGRAREALKSLKPQELRALTLLAEGYSYSEICERTGWTYTKAAWRRSAPWSLLPARRSVSPNLTRRGIACCGLSPARTRIRSFRSRPTQPSAPTPLVDPALGMSDFRPTFAASIEEVAVNELASRLRSLPSSDLSLAVAAGALGIAALLGYLRMQNSWADFPLFLLIAVPCALLFALALAPGTGGNRAGTGSDGRLAPWQTTCFLVAIPLLAGSILLLIKLLGKDDPGTGTATWVLLLTGVGAAVISARYDSPGATVLAALALSGAGLTAINWIDDEADVAVYRDVLLIEAAILLLIARSMWDAGRAHAKQLVAIAGIGLISGALTGAIDTVSPAGLLVIPSSSTIAEEADGWMFILIAASIGLLAFAAWQRHGGSALIGLYGVANFVYISGEGDLGGWPLLLGLAALACLAWALLLRPAQNPGSTSPPAAQPPPT